MSDTTRRFPLGTLLFLATGRLLFRGAFGELSQLLTYMTGQVVYTHQVYRVIHECMLPLFQQHPALSPGAMKADLARLDSSLEGVTSDEQYYSICAGWVEDLAGVLGAELEVSPLSDYEPRDPVEELVEMAGADRVIVVTGESQ